MKVLHQPIPVLRSIPRFQTDLASLVLRLGLAAVFLCHGLPKVGVEWTGEGAGFAFFPEREWGANWIPGLFGIQPGPGERAASFKAAALAVAWGEVLGGAALALGLFTRLVACGLIIIQSTAIYLALTFEVLRTVGGGAEYNFALVAMLLALVFMGAGNFSVDRLLSKAPPEGADTTSAANAPAEPVGAGGRPVP
jgi:putative oxidoreductase